MIATVVTFVCPVCRRESRVAAFPFRCSCKHVAQAAHGMPSLITRAVNFAREGTAHVLSGRELVDEATRDWRKQKCLSCVEHFNAELETCTHPRCGCGMKKQRGIIDALGWASKRCPIGRWDDPPPRWISNSDLARDTLALVGALPPNLAGVVGVPRSGMLPASILATHLHLPLFSWRDSIEPVGNGWRLSDAPEFHGDGPLLVIDDTSYGGNTSKNVRSRWKEVGRGRELIFAAVYSTPRQYHRVGPMPDLAAAIVDPPHFLEWNFFNSTYVPHTAFDFDGVLTIDGTTQPLHLPRKWPVELIVTGRFERDRAGSEAWLREHGINCKRLVMYPGSLAERDQPGAIAAYKAEHFQASALKWFVESDAEQAQAIARLTGKHVLCPPAGKVF